MILVFQILTVVTVAIASFFVARGRGARHQAIRRLLMLVFAVAAASSVFFPQTWTWAANRVGIGRGTDLLLYLLVLTFIGFVASTYRHFRQLEGQMTELARRLALMSEVKPTGK